MRRLKVGSMTALRVIHLPEMVGGNAWGLSQGLRAIGVQSETWSLLPPAFGYKSDRVISAKEDSLIKREVAKILSLRYVFLFDIVFLNFGRTLFAPVTSHTKNNIIGVQKFKARVLVRIFNYYQLSMQGLEIWLLKILRRKILVQFQGDDARQSDVFQQRYGIDYSSLNGQTIDVDYFNKVKRGQVIRLTNAADKIYALNPDVLAVLPSQAEFLPYANLDIHTWLPVKPRSNNSFTFGHAPSSRGIKGTVEIIEAVNQLKSQGMDVELLLIENMSNLAARELYEKVDVLIDQLHIGWYGGVAVELMALGKPVACFIRDSDLEFIPRDMAGTLPILRIKKKTLTSDLKKIVAMRGPELMAVGKSSRHFVESYHDPKEIAQRIYSDILVFE